MERAGRKRTGALAALSLAAALVAGCALFTNFHFGQMDDYERDPSLATLGGVIEVPGLEGKVEVFRDDYGVPHIFSDNEHDLFFAIGYVQAQDRLFQITLLNAIAEGRMAELFGDFTVPGMEMSGMPLSTTGIDKHQRVMGMKYLGEVGEAMLREQDPKVFAQSQAFCDGVNAYIDSLEDESDLPIEYRILGIRPEHIRVADIITFGKFIGTLLCSNLAIEAPRHAAIQKYGADMGWELFPIYGAQGPSIVPTEYLENRLPTPRDLPPGGRPSDDEIGFVPEFGAEAALMMAFAEGAYRKALFLDPTMGSNNWVVAGKHTVSGKPMLANDPHLQHIEPSLFYLMRIKGAGYDCMGITFPGSPYVVLGRGRKFAWGATTSRADVQDLFVETVDPDRPGMYKYKGEWIPFTERTDVIRIRSGKRYKEEKVVIRQTVHGPVMNDFVSKLPDDTPPVALRWTGWDISRDVRAFELLTSSTSAEEFMDGYHAMDKKFEFLSFLGFLERVMRAESVGDFIKAMDVLDMPNQNWVAIDDAGRIAYLPGGLVPIRGKGIGVLPVPGESGEFDWTGFIPVMELPHMIDPDRGWIASANNQVVDPRYYPHVFSTHYAEPWRAMRIEELIEELAPLDEADMVRIQNDVQVRRAAWMVPLILEAVENKSPKDRRVLEAYREFKDWDYEADLDSTATVILFEFIRELFDNVLADDVDKKTLKAMHLEGYPTMVIDLWLERGEHRFFDDRRTKGKVEDMDDMIVKSLSDAMSRIDRKWGRSAADREWGGIHVIKFYHLLGFGKGAAMSVGPFPHLGADHTVRNAKAAYFGTVPYKTFNGPCFKHIIDMGDPDRALMVIDGSQSGQWLSPHYDDMHQMFVDGEYLATDMDEENVKRSAAYRLVLTP